MSLVDLLQAEAFRLGFPLYGIAPVITPPHFAVYQQWIGAGRQAGMDYLASERALERRANPALIQPGTRSLLVVGMRYPSPDSIHEGPEGEASGRVAAYAWGDDYHEVIPPRLAEIGAALEKSLHRAVQTRAYTDTGPILERDFAQQAGLGWAGKNTCLIDPRSGSYYLLGEMFLNVELEPSQPIQSDHCGTCRRCIESCPTQAIREDRTIDSGRCISYLTIENKGSIPPELRPAMADWVFGCDICQMVCPWNLRFAAPEGHPALNPQNGDPRPVLRKELGLSPQVFNQKFRHSPIRRAKRRGYLRNVTVALGNAGDPSTVTELAETLENEPETMVRAHAAWALGQIGTKPARTALEKSLKKEPQETVTAEIRSALG